jgi:hypothetical protein
LFTCFYNPSFLSARCHYWGYNNTTRCDEDAVDGSGGSFCIKIHPQNNTSFLSTPVGIADPIYFFGPQSQGSANQYSGIVSCAQTILREEGPGAFLKVAKFFLSPADGGGCTGVVIELGGW